MSVHKLFRIGLPIIFLLLTSFFVVAQNPNWDSPEPTNLVQAHQSIFTKLFPSGFAIVNGGQCSINPDDAGKISNLIPTEGKVFCPQDSTGCRLCLYNAFFDLTNCNDISAGTSKQLDLGSSGYWERYNCYPNTCMEKTEFQNKDCGGWVCKDDEMYRERKDTCGHTDQECVPASECRPQKCAYSVGEWGQCVNGEQSKTVIFAGCDQTTEKQKCGTSTITGSGLLIEGINEEAEVIEGNIIQAKTILKNVGSKMSGTIILEMQVRPRGQLPLAVVGEQEVCDSAHPENPHRQIRLDEEESTSIILRTEKEMDDGKYDVFLLSRTKCFKDLTNAEQQDLNTFWRTQPYPSSKLIGRVCVGDDCFNEQTTPGQSIFTKLWFWMILIGIVLILLGAYLQFRN